MIRWWFSVMFSRRFAVMSFRLMLFAFCSVLHKVSSVPQGISDKKHNFVLCRAIFYLCGNRFRFLCFVISYKKAQKKPPGNKGVLPLYRAACCAVVCPHFKRTVLILSFVLFQVFQHTHNYRGCLRSCRIGLWCKAPIRITCHNGLFRRPCYSVLRIV